MTVLLEEIGENVQLRVHLRQETADSHSTLDALAEPQSLDDPRHYAAFLTRQYRARLPIEQWVAAHCPDDLAPPPMTALIAADMHVCEKALPIDLQAFALPEGAEAIGLAWAIAGSHLGNRMMLKQLRDASSELPTHFLADETMAAHWRMLRPRLDAAVSLDQAQGPIAAAQAVFSHFQAAFIVGQSDRIAA